MEKHVKKAQEKRKQRKRSFFDVKRRKNSFAEV